MQEDLDHRQAEIDREYDAQSPKAGELINQHWNRFKALDNSRARQRAPSVKAALDALSHCKCAYCEGPEWKDIEHAWPKAPAPENARRGTPARMFRWTNLLPACGTCNAPEHKGSTMEWIGEGRALRPKLLDPSAEGDDPLSYFTIQPSDAPRIEFGWIDPRPGLSGDAYERARFTIELLGLNTRDAVLRGRRHTLTSFHVLLRAVTDLAQGPDAMLETGRTVREAWVEFLSAKSPYLAPLRQIFHEKPAVKEALVERMPELGDVIDAWDLPPDDCVHTREAAAEP